MNLGSPTKNPETILEKARMISQKTLSESEKQQARQWIHECDLLRQRELGARDDLAFAIAEFTRQI